MTEPFRALGYVRQSSAKEGETADTSLSLDSQAFAIARLCEDRGWTLVDVIRDHDLKGDNPDRPGLQSVITRARSVDAVVVFAMSRLARDNLLQETIWRQLQLTHTRLISVTEPAAEDDMVRGILGVVSQAERKRMGRFISNSLRTKQERGQYVGTAPFGYRFGPDHVLEPDPINAPIVQRIAAEIVAGRRFVDVMRDLDRDGIASPRGTVWRNGTFKSLMSNPVLAGMVRLKSDGGLVEGNHPPIITIATLETVQQRFGVNPRIRSKPVSSFAEGSIRHECGNPMYVYGTELKRRRYPSLFRVARCKDNRAVGGRCPEAKHEASVNRIEWAVRHCIAVDLSSILTVAEARAFWKRDHDGGTQDRRRAQLQKRRVQAEQKHRDARDRWFAGKWSDTLMDEADTRLSTALNEINAELAALPVEPNWSEIERFANEMPSIAATVLAIPDDAMGDLLRRLGVIVWGEQTAQMRYHPNVALLIPAPVVLSVPARVSYPTPRRREP